MAPSMIKKITCVSRKYYKLSYLKTQYRSTNNASNDEKTHFGFETVSPEEKAEKVQSVFSSVASRYDLMNDIMSGGIHRIWKDQFIATLHPTPGTKLIDVAGGTGDIAFRFLKYLKPYPSEVQINNQTNYENCYEPESHVTVCDFNNDMLKIGEQRAKEFGLTTGISWVNGDAQNLPFRDNSFDAYTISFGIRNVVNVEKALDEAYRVLRPGGRFLCLEFSHVKYPLLSSVYDWYSFEVLPVFGQIFTRDWKSYQYLAESIRKFPDQEEYRVMLMESGFENVFYTNLLCGVAAIHSGFKL